MANVRERVRLAREIESLDLQIRRDNDNRNWKKKAADDIGILDSSEDDSDDDQKNNRVQKQVNQAIKQKKFALGKLLSAKIVPSNVQSLKFPIGSTVEVESNPMVAVKNVMAAKKGKGIKLFRNKKKTAKK